MSDILLRERDGGTVVLTMNRPEKLNALNEALVRALHDAVAELDADMSVRVVVLTGAGEKAFVAGADIAAMSEMSTTAAKAFAAYWKLARNSRSWPRPATAARPSHWRNPRRRMSFCST